MAVLTLRRLGRMSSHAINQTVDPKSRLPFRLWQLTGIWRPRTKCFWCFVHRSLQAIHCFIRRLAQSTRFWSNKSGEITVIFGKCISLNMRLFDMSGFGPIDWRRQFVTKFWQRRAVKFIDLIMATEHRIIFHTAQQAWLFVFIVHACSYLRCTGNNFFDNGR